METLLKDGKRYIRIDLYDEMKRQRDMLADHIGNIHQEAHLAKRALNAARRKPNGQAEQPAAQGA